MKIYYKENLCSIELRKMKETLNVKRRGGEEEKWRSRDERCM